MIDKLKKRWGVTSGWQFFAIFMAFSLAGPSIVYARAPIYQLMGIPPGTSLWIQIPLGFLAYQVFLLFWGTVLGQFRFFWEKEKKMGRFLLVGQFRFYGKKLQQLGRFLFGWTPRKGQV